MLNKRHFLHREKVLRKKSHIANIEIETFTEYDGLFMEEKQKLRKKDV